VILSAQLAAEKLPVNFLLFTGSLIFALSLVVLAKRAGRPASGCNFGQTNPTTASRMLLSFDLNPGVPVRSAVSTRG
jgi:hypothetical protein